MAAANYNVIGIMSGTSLDGIDLAHLHFCVSDSKWDFEILETETISYDSNWLQTLKDAVDYDEQQLITLNIDYTDLLAEIISKFIKVHDLQNIDAICSHGHTILHQPQNGFTLQIGNLPHLAKALKQTIVCDFRVADVALGGQGAPLVPIGDRILFSNYDYCLNLGGFSNISFEENGNRIAFDISAVNTVLNFYSEKLGFAFDDKGEIARFGTINSDLLNELNALEYYQKPHPKSLGFEYVKEVLLPILEKSKITIQDKMRTFAEHVATQIPSAIAKKNGKILITGGGAYNDFLIERLKLLLPQMTIEIPSKKLLEYKEALIFGLLGVLKLRNEINVLNSVTGASHDHSSGIIFYP